jgi:hypothetical protein
MWPGPSARRRPVHDGAGLEPGPAGSERILLAQRPPSGGPAYGDRRPELYAAVQGQGYAARDRYAAHYRQYFRTESRLLHLLKAAALLGRPRGVHGEHRTRRQLLQQAGAIEAALVAQGFYKETTDEEAARGCVRIGLGLVHHVAGGASLPPDCSAGHDW